MIGDVIRAARIAAGLTQHQLGLLCGYGDGAAARIIQYWESGTRDVPITKVRTLAQVLNIPIESLIP